jgi:seryl-tRNA synthetase
MARCAATKLNGEQCTRIVSAEQRFCYSHDPERASERSLNASRGGKAKAAKEVRDLKAEIKAVITDVRAGILERNDASAMIQGYRALKDFLELERRIREQKEMEERLQVLEHALEAAEAARGA